MTQISSSPSSTLFTKLETLVLLVLDHSWGFPPEESTTVAQPPVRAPVAVRICEQQYITSLSGCLWVQFRIYGCHISKLLCIYVCKIIAFVNFQEIKEICLFLMYVRVLVDCSQGCRCPAYSGTLPGQEVSGDIDTAYRTVADHSRMFTVSIADGLLPGRQDSEWDTTLLHLFFVTFSLICFLFAFIVNDNWNRMSEFTRSVLVLRLSWKWMDKNGWAGV